MARTAIGAALTAQHRQQQLALRARLLSELLLLWPLFQPADLTTFEPFAAAATILIRARHRDAAGLAAGYYGAFRLAEGIPGEFRPVIAEQPPADRVALSLRATGLLGVLNARRAGRSLSAASDVGLVRVSGSASRLVIAGAQDTIVDSLGRDRARPRWHRATSGSACAFCRMLASRGAVYHSQETGGFQAHDHCSCVPEPAYSGSALPPEAQRYRQQWDEATRGLSGDEAVTAFRQAVEGRASDTER